MTDSTSDAALCAAAKRMRSEVWHLTGTHRLARYRSEWPDFWAAVDDIVAVLDEVDPPKPLPPLGG